MSPVLNYSANSYISVFLVVVVRVLSDWYGKIFTVITWNNELSYDKHYKWYMARWYVFAIYISMNSIISAMKAADYGCHIDNILWLYCVR